MHLMGACEQLNFLLKAKKISTVLKRIYRHSMASHKQAWRAIESWVMVKNPQKRWSIQPRKILHNWPFWAREDTTIYIEDKKWLVLILDIIDNTSWCCANICEAPFCPEKEKTLRKGRSVTSETGQYWTLTLFYDRLKNDRWNINWR